jgi:hypothetical protein
LWVANNPSRAFWDGERSAERVSQRNGYRTRPWDTRVGTIALEIPKLRHGSYFPSWLLEPRRRAEQALVFVREFADERVGQHRTFRSADHCGTVAR